jgi:hypothetical protein
MIRHNCTIKYKLLVFCSQGPLAGPPVGGYSLYTAFQKKTPKEDYLFIFSDKAILKVIIFNRTQMTQIRLIYTDFIRDNLLHQCHPCSIHPAPG